MKGNNGVNVEEKKKDSFEDVFHVTNVSLMITGKSSLTYISDGHENEVL